jgi:amino acid adenylation domain-containing protein
MAYLLQQLLTDAAARGPHRPAVVADDGQLTYQELDEHSNKVARALLRLGVAPGDRVGILAPKSAASVIGIYGVLKAGACYVPLDPKAPAQRLRYVVHDSGARIVVTDEQRVHEAADLLTGVLGRAVVVTSFAGSGVIEDSSGGTAHGAEIISWATVAVEPSGPLPAELAIETDLAYILYTSGSTGTPKGVMISHRNSLTFVNWSASAARLCPEDRVCSPAPLHFDLSVFDIFASCLSGACTTVIPEGTTTFPVSIVRWMGREGISVWYSVPSVLTLLASYGSLGKSDLSRLRLVIFAGEVFPPRYLAQLMRELPHPRYLNWYGPTETNVCTAFEVSASGPDGKPVPIGRACANTEVFAITSNGARVSQPGEAGELYVRGPSLMRGYWAQPARAREVLVPSPLEPERGELVYRTGDLVTLDDWGNYVFVGRRDSMVKVRGYRVELGDVEAALYRHPVVQEVVVVPVPDERCGNRLLAVIAARDIAPARRETVLDHCRQWLPAYMVPEVVEFREALPRTSTGKVDRVALACELRCRDDAELADQAGVTS